MRSQHLAARYNSHPHTLRCCTHRQTLSLKIKVIILQIPSSAKFQVMLYKGLHSASPWQYVAENSRTPLLQGLEEWKSQSPLHYTLAKTLHTCLQATKPQSSHFLVCCPHKWGTEFSISLLPFCFGRETPFYQNNCPIQIAHLILLSGWTDYKPESTLQIQMRIHVYPLQNVCTDMLMIPHTPSQCGLHQIQH